MSKFLICECCNQTYLEEDMSKNNKNMCCSCWCYTRPKDKRIAELEKQLANSIRPKFKVGQECYLIDDKFNCFHNCKEYNIVRSKIKKHKNVYYVEDYGINHEEDLFATKEEAQAKLKELQGEQNGKID